MRAAHRAQGQSVKTFHQDGQGENLTCHAQRSGFSVSLNLLRRTGYALTNSSGARNLFSATEARSQGFTTSLVTLGRAQPQSSCFCCTPLSAIKAQARRELQYSEQMGKSNWAEASGLLSWPSCNCWHAKDFRIFKTTCVD